jgi:hypothetical protein
MKQDKIKIENGRLAIILREILGGKNLINEDKEFDEEYCFKMFFIFLCYYIYNNVKINYI